MRHELPYTEIDREKEKRQEDQTERITWTATHKNR